MSKKYLLLLSLCVGISTVPFAAKANFGKKLEAIKNSKDPTVDKLSAIYTEIDNAYQNLDDGKMTAEQIGLQLSTKAAKAAAVAREIAEADGSTGVKEELDRVTEHTEFISCYALNNREYKNLMEALNSDNDAGKQAMLGKTVMCRKIAGIARVKDVNDTTLILENIAGTTPDSQEWGSALDVGTHIIFDSGNKTPVRV